MFQKFRILLLLLSLLLPFVTPGHHIMFFHNIGTRSHIIQMKPLIKELLDRGNAVTAAIFASTELAHENLTEVLLPTDLDALYANGSRLLMGEGGASLLNPDLWFWFYDFYHQMLRDLALDMFRPLQLQQLIKKGPKVDLVVTTWPWGAVFGEIFDSPIVIFTPSSPMPFSLTGTTGIVDHSLQPFPMAPFIEPMTFSNRLVNYSIVAFATVFFDWITKAMAEHQKEMLMNQFSLALPPQATSF